VGGSKTCADCGESYNAGTDLSRWGCRCLKAKYCAAKANRGALNDVQPEAPADGQEIGGRVQCEDCWGFYNKGTNLRLYGCPCQKAKLEAVFAEPGECKGYCPDLQCANPSPCSLHESHTCGGDNYDGFTVYYWPGFSGRAQPAMAMLAEAGAKYRRLPEPCKETDCFAVPQVQKGNFCLAQTLAVCQYLGEELGFNHPPALRHVATKLSADIGDLWNDVYQKRCDSANWQAVDDWCKNQIADWFCTLDYAAGKYGSPGYFLGNKLSYVDFLLWSTLEVVAFCYGQERLTKLWVYGPRLAAIHANVASRPGVAAYAKEEPVLYPGAKHDASIPVEH